MTHTRFSVWAPGHTEIELEIREPTGSARLEPDDGNRAGEAAITRIGLEPSTNGWWSLPRDRPPSPVLDALDGDESAQVDYGYWIDGRGPFPDPRSRRQPNGVHALSRTVPVREGTTDDRAGERWVARSARGAVIYELHIGTFTPSGTFAGAIDKLDHLRSIGVEFVELLPVNAFNGPRNWGYDGVGWFAVHEEYGGPSGYRSFVAACHAAGIGVIQDVVYNHLGPSGNYLPEFGPYLRSEGGTTWGQTVNLDGPDSDEVRRFILDNVEMWFSEYDVDGLRLDAVHALVDSRAIHILEEIAAHTDELSNRLGRPLTVIAESDRNDPRVFEPRAVGGYGLAAQWSDDYHHALRVALTADASGYYADFADPAALATTIERGFFHANTYSSFRGRHHGRAIRSEISDPDQLVVFSQNHDQIGNRAAGDRLSALLSDGQLAIAATLTMLGPGTPQLFMGEEWAASTPWQYFTSHPEPELAEATAAGRLREFAAMGWDPSDVPDPQDPATFERSRLRWDELADGRHARLLSFYRQLAAERARASTTTTFGSVVVSRPEAIGSSSGLSTTGLSTTGLSSAGRWLAMATDTRLVIVNFGREPERVSLEPLGTVSPSEPVLSFGSAEYSVPSGSITLGAHSLVVLSLSPLRRVASE